MLISRVQKMSKRPRVAKVLAALLISMTVGAIVLLALGNNPPSAGPFCLASYYRLDPIEKAVYSRAEQTLGRWKSIEVMFSNTKGGNISQLASLSGCNSAEELNCHFVICNNLGGKDGQIMTAEKWLRQWSLVPSKHWFGNERTLRICVIGDGKNYLPTDSQVKRTQALIDNLCRKFQISANNVFYPKGW
jgi:hypothetical protein